MNLDLLDKDNKDKLEYSEVYSRLHKKVDNLYLPNDDYNTSSKVKMLLKEWYIKGYFQALDDYKKLAK